MLRPKRLLMQPVVPFKFVTYTELMGREHQAIPGDPIQ